MNLNVSSSSAPCVNPLGITAGAVTRIGTDSLAGLRTSARPFSQLIDQPGKREREKESAEDVQVFLARARRHQTEKPRPTPPEHRLNDSQPLTDNKTRIKFA